MSTHLPTEPKYSYKWAQSIVETFLEKYTRGWYFCAKMIAHTPAELEWHGIQLLRSGNSMRWETFKKSIRVMDRESWDDFKGMPLEERKKWVTFVKWFSEDAILSEEKPVLPIDKQKNFELSL